MEITPNSTIKCSFCRKFGYQVPKVIASKDSKAYICEECVAKCVATLLNNDIHNTFATCMAIERAIQNVSDAGTSPTAP